MQKQDLRIIFMGTPEFAVGTLSRLVEGGYNVVAVVTQPDKPVGRHQDVLQPSEVKKYAVAHGLPVLQPVKMKDPAFVEELAFYKADLQVVVAFRMLPEVVWAMPRLGTFNVHAALLPQYRGAAPINWAVINGEKETGVTTFFLDHDIDTGRIILQKHFPIPAEADVEYVYDGLMRLGADAAIETVDKVLALDDSEGRASYDQIETIPQDDLIAEMAKAKGIAPSEVVLHGAPKIFKDTCRIDWNRTAQQVHDFIRGLSPYPGAWTTLSRDGGKAVVVKIFRSHIEDFSEEATCRPGDVIASRGTLAIACADTLLYIDELQMAGKKRMDVKSFLNGVRNIGEYRVVDE